LRSDNAVWFLTHNSDKFREASAILAPLGVRIRHLDRSKIEIQDSRQENIAKFALLNALEGQNKQILVEDSGIFIEDLNGFPGPYSSYVYDTIGLKGVLAVLRRHKVRRAYFQATVAFGSPTVNPRLFRGRVTGRISDKILGRNGFGYDPIFIPDGYKKTFGQSSQAFKNERSHRARAFQNFARWFAAR
jgi:XTP/dITP diphosphohydrolase